MKELTVTDAIAHVRHNIDELEMNGSSMFGEEMDAAALDILCARHLPSAVEYVHRQMPAGSLDGVKAPEEEIHAETDEYGVISVRIAADMTRLVSFRASDSMHVLTGYVKEDSPEGRMQLNRHVCGRYDSPVLVRVDGSMGHRPAFRYYSAKDPSEPPELEIIYLPYQADGSQSYMVADHAVQPVLDRLTGLVLSSYGESERAQLFFDRSNSWQSLP